MKPVLACALAYVSVLLRLRDNLLVLKRRKRTGHRCGPLVFGSTCVFRSTCAFRLTCALLVWIALFIWIRATGIRKGVPVGNGLPQLGAGLSDRLLGGPLAVKLEVGPDPLRGEAGEKLCNPAGPDANIGELLS